MKVLYCRVSTLDQKTDRQRINESNYDYIVEDKCSGAIPFFERNGGQKIKELIEKGALTSLEVSSIDRMGRDLRDIINSIHYFNSKKIPIHIIAQKLTTLDDVGSENPMSKMMISILGIVGEMERNQIRERQLEGIRIAKAKGVYKGRVTGTKEDTLTFLSKEKNKAALDYLKRGLKGVEVAKLTGLTLNTITKIKKIGMPG